MLTLTGVCTVLPSSVLFLILGFLVYNGWRSLNWDFFTKLPLPRVRWAAAWPMPLSEAAL